MVTVTTVSGSSFSRTVSEDELQPAQMPAIRKVTIWCGNLMSKNVLTDPSTKTDSRG